MWLRALAFLIDLTLFLILATIENVAGIAENGFIGLSNLLLLIIYFTCMDYWYGGTLGKRIVGLRVALRPSPDVFYWLFVRAFMKIISFFPPLFTVYALMGIWRQDGRSLADFASGSTVIEVSSCAPPKQASVIERICASILVLFAPLITLVILMVTCWAWMLAENWDELSPFLKLFLFS